MIELKEKSKITNIASLLIIFLAAIYILREMATWLQPLFIALFLYYVSTPLIRFLTNHKMPSGWAHTTVLTLMAFLVIGFGWILASNISHIASRLPEFQKILVSIGLSASRSFHFLPSFQKEIREYLANTNLLAPSSDFIRTFVNGSSAFVSNSVLIFFYLVFIVHEAQTMPSHLKRAMGIERAEKLIAVTHHINDDIIRYIYIKFLASVMRAVAAAVLLVFYDVPLAALWAGIMFVASFIPYLGPTFATFLIGFVTYLHLQVWTPVLVLSGLLIACDMLVGNYWEPKYTGYHLNLSPLVLLASLCFWGWLWGIVGMILAVPIMVSIRYVLENFATTRTLGLLMSYEKRKTDRYEVKRQSLDPTQQHKEKIIVPEGEKEPLAITRPS